MGLGLGLGLAASSSRCTCEWVTRLILSLGAAFGGLADGFEGAGAADQEAGERPGPWLWRCRCRRQPLSQPARRHAGRPLHELVQHVLPARVLREEGVEQRRQLLPVELPVPVLVVLLAPAVELRLLLLLVEDPLLVQRRLPFHSRRRLDLQHHGAYAPVRAAPIRLATRSRHGTLLGPALRRNSALRRGQPSSGKVMVY